MVTVVLRWISLVVPKILVNVAVVMLCDDSSMTAFLNLWMAASGEKHGLCKMLWKINGNVYKLRLPIHLKTCDFFNVAFHLIFYELPKIAFDYQKQL